MTRMATEKKRAKYIRDEAGIAYSHAVHILRARVQYIPRAIGCKLAAALAVVRGEYIMPRAGEWCVCSACRPDGKWQATCEPTSDWRPLSPLRAGKSPEVLRLRPRKP